MVPNFTPKHAVQRSRTEICFFIFVSHYSCSPPLISSCFSFSLALHLLLSLPTGLPNTISVFHLKRLPGAVVFQQSEQYTARHALSTPASNFNRTLCKSDNNRNLHADCFLRHLFTLTADALRLSSLSIPWLSSLEAISEISL